MAIKIFIDQGHNPQAPNAGAEGNGLREQDIVYPIGIELAALLDSNGNFETMLSRPTPQTQLGATNSESLRLRVDMANAWRADYFISLHTNASENPNVSGSEALVFSRLGAAARLGEAMLVSLSEATGLRNRGLVERPGLYVLKKTEMPAVLMELGFITNEGDAFLMRDNPALFATGLYNGILSYFAL